jgi:methylated-DNA-[protein]-cysteine S-methyltransferase
MEQPLFKEYFESPVGWMEVIATDDEIISVLFKGKIKDENIRINSLTTTCIDVLKAYFKGEQKQFDLPLQIRSTSFQQKVLAAVSAIPYGTTVTYHDIARQLKQPHAVRAVGAANGKNKLLIVIPCHRVIGADGSLVGYAGELWRKKWLLDHESKHSGKGQLMLDF